MEDRYARYLAGDWKNEQDAMRKAGYVLSYKVIRTEAHNPTDCNVILMTEYKDLATMEANADKAEQLGQELFGGTPKIESGYMDRSSYRDIIGSRLAREIVLEPKK
jgi:flagellar motor switch protein FliM